MTSSKHSQPAVLSLFVFDQVWVADDFMGVGYGGVFTEEDIAALVEFGSVLRGIRSRLVAEGKMTDTICKN